jgi:hypothetical protein
MLRKANPNSHEPEGPIMDKPSEPAHRHNDGAKA